MHSNDRKNFAALVSATAEVYDKTVSEALLAMWWDDMSTFDYAAVADAFRRHRASPDSGQYMPKPADIVRMLAGSSVDKAMVAWALVDKAVREIGPYRTVCFDNALTNRVLLDMGGWIELCRRDDAAWPFVANEFRTRFHGYVSRGEQPEYPRSLLGITDAENATKGFAAQEVTLLGQLDAASAVYAGGSAVSLQAQAVSIADLMPPLRLLPGGSK